MKDEKTNFKIRYPSLKLIFGGFFVVAIPTVIGYLLTGRVEYFEFGLGVELVVIIPVILAVFSWWRIFIFDEKHKKIIISSYMFFINIKKEEFDFNPQLYFLKLEKIYGSGRFGGGWSWVLYLVIGSKRYLLADRCFRKHLLPLIETIKLSTGILEEFK